MKIYWSLKLIPELAEMPKKERKVIWRQCYLEAFQHWQTWGALIVCGGCAALGMAMGDLISNFSKVLGAAIGGSIGGFVFAQVSITMARRHVSEYLNSHNEAPHA